MNRLLIGPIRWAYNVKETYRSVSDRNPRSEIYAWWLALRFVLTGTTGNFRISKDGEPLMNASITTAGRLNRALLKSRKKRAECE